MNWLTDEQKQIIRTMAASKHTHESCGFVTKDGIVFMVENTADDPVNQFRIDPIEYARFENIGILGVWHSHLEMDGFSPADQNAIRADNLPWAVYCLRTDVFHCADPNAIAPYIGRPFVYGVYDCYSLVTDYLLLEHDIELPYHGRGAYGEWDTPEFNAFDISWHTEATRIVAKDRLRDGDIIGLNLGKHRGHTDHVGVINGDLQLLHHLADQPSRVDVWGESWQRRVTWAVRPNVLR